MPVVASASSLTQLYVMKGLPNRGPAAWGEEVDAPRLTQPVLPNPGLVACVDEPPLTPPRPPPLLSPPPPPPPPHEVPS